MMKGIASDIRVLMSSEPVFAEDIIWMNGKMAEKS
jgi:hypothetical protein